MFLFVSRCRDVGLAASARVIRIRRVDAFRPQWDAPLRIRPRDIRSRRRGFLRIHERGTCVVFRERLAGKDSGK
ncbi:hypothetical protein FACS1894206_01040 [Deltaproteobacteria bacterium]|nr:hypothetical protein FACS1894206_01040 [Deltaproteobacteria bacterium]